MNLFDRLVTEALKNQPHLSHLRIVVEKELLHHDILRILSDNNLLKDLTFIGGTCLRSCYGGIRLSEDLDFTGGSEFKRDSLSAMATILTSNLQDKYGLRVSVSEPIKDKQNVDTWKIKIETRPQTKNMPAQRINIDICAIPSYEKLPVLILNPYGIDMGTGGLVLQAQSREEIFIDKLVAFAFRPNRIKYRDLWDILWLHGQGLKPKFDLLPEKLRDRSYSKKYFITTYNERMKMLVNTPEMISEFKKEMMRFLPIEHATKTLEQENFWPFIAHLIEDLGRQLDK